MAWNEDKQYVHEKNVYQILSISEVFIHCTHCLQIKKRAANVSLWRRDSISV